MASETIDVNRLQYMLTELQANRLEVTKVPGKHGGYIRVTVSVNCGWYRELCKRHLSTRRRYPRQRTFIKRGTTVAALKRMIAGDRSTVYAQRIIEVYNDGHTCH